MSGVVYISGLEHELAQLMAEYGPKWGLEVAPAVEAMALAGEAQSTSSTTGSIELQPPAGYVDGVGPTGVRADPDGTFDVGMPSETVREKTLKLVAELVKQGALSRTEIDEVVTDALGYRPQ